MFSYSSWDIVLYNNFILYGSVFPTYWKVVIVILLTYDIAINTVQMWHLMVILSSLIF